MTPERTHGDTSEPNKLRLECGPVRQGVEVTGTETALGYLKTNQAYLLISAATIADIQTVGTEDVVCKTNVFQYIYLMHEKV